MLYFREAEKERIKEFERAESKKAMAIYGRRRTGKTELVLDYINNGKSGNAVYFQCAGYDYDICLEDFKIVVSSYYPGDVLIDSFSSFRDLLVYLDKISENSLMIIIDEFPFLCKKNENVAVEFQWIIDHTLNRIKLVLLGSNLSFMKRQINDEEAPLYGRFDEIIKVDPFTFSEVRQLFDGFEKAVEVFSMTGGVAQYVMFFKEYSSVSKAVKALYFDKNGRLLQEANNMLMQELRDITTYVAILRAIAGSGKSTGQIAKKAGLDPRGIFAYLTKLQELDIIAVMDNPLSKKKNEKRYYIKDLLFRFNYSFIEPNISMITALGEKSKEYILGERYDEYLGFVYEEIIRESCFSYAAEGRLPFMPFTVGKWWGNVKHDGKWCESEVDLIAYDKENIVIGECKYRNKKTGKKELQELREKAIFIPVQERKTVFLLASRSGFTDELKKENVILIEQV